MLMGGLTKHTEDLAPSFGSYSSVSTNYGILRRSTYHAIASNPEIPEFGLLRGGKAPKGPKSLKYDKAVSVVNPFSDELSHHFSTLVNAIRVSRRKWR